MQIYRPQQASVRRRHDWKSGALQVVVEYVPLRHYILRHNKAIFWTLQVWWPAAAC